VQPPFQSALAALFRQSQTASAKDERGSCAPDERRPALGAVATVSAANGFEKSVKGKVNVALAVLGPGTS
jgi:hypothetical protein